MRKLNQLNEKPIKMSNYLTLQKRKISKEKDPFVISKHEEWKKPDKVQYNLFQQNTKLIQANESNEGIDKDRRSLSNVILPTIKEKNRMSQEKVVFQKGKSHEINKNQTAKIADKLLFRLRKSISNPDLIKIKKLNTKEGQFILQKLRKNHQSAESKNTQQNILSKQQQIIQSRTNQKHEKSYSQHLSLSKRKPLNIQTRRNIYTSIKNYNKEEQLWVFHLCQQLCLQVVISQLQKIELNRNVQPSKKLTMRQAYQLKREIVIEIQKEKSLSIQKNIEKLTELALDEKEKDKFLMIGLFVSLREKLKSPSDKNTALVTEIGNSPNESLKNNFRYRKDIIEQIKAEIKTWKWYKFDEATLMNIKILSVLSLHILKLQSPIFSPEDIELISRTIRLKKKGYSLIDYLSDHQKRLYLQSLIYLIYQFYKNLYYLKLDQEIKIQQYDLLRAYIDYYRSKDQENYKNFQKRYRIDNTVQSIKPSSVGIYPYQDSRARNQIKFKNIQNELNGEPQNNDETKTKHKITVNEKNLSIHIKKQKQMQALQNSSQSQSSDQSSSDLSSQQYSSFALQNKSQISPSNKQKSLKNIPKPKQQSPQKKIGNRNSLQIKNNKLIFKIKTQNTLKLKCQGLQSIDQNEEKIQKKEQKDKEFNPSNFCFPFLLFKQNQLLSGQFRIQTTKEELNLKIKLAEYRGNNLILFKFKVIKGFSEILNSQNFQKFLWRVFKKIFVMNYMQLENPFLMKEHIQDSDQLKKYTPGGISDSELRLVEIIHDYLVFWLKMRRFDYQLNGKTIALPRFNPEEMNQYLQNSQHEHDRKLFIKRQGFIGSTSIRRNGSMSPQQILTYNSLQNEFVIAKSDTNKKYLQALKQQNIVLLVKIEVFEKVEFKFVKLIFWKRVRQMSIFEIGFFKHEFTNLVEKKVPEMRKIKNQHGIYRQRLIHISQEFLTSVKKIFPIDNDNENGQNEFSLIKKYKIQQQFQVQLTKEFKLIPTIPIKLINAIDLIDPEVDLIKKNSIKRIKNKSVPSSKIYHSFIKETQNSQNYTRSSAKRSQSSMSWSKFFNLTIFKIQNMVLIAREFNYDWGKRFLSLGKILQFFQINSCKNKLVYKMDRISLYKVGVFHDSEILQFEYNDKVYNYYLAKKPFLSKIGKEVSQTEQTSFDSQNIDSQQNFNRPGRRLQDRDKVEFIEEKIFFTLNKQKILKFNNKDKIQYYSFQMYQTITIISNETKFISFNKKSQNIFIYQLINLQKSQTKYYLLTQKQISFSNSQQLTHLINIEEMSLMGQKMESFAIPVHKIHYINQFHQSKTKILRKKIISETNYFFQQKVLEMCNNIRNQQFLMKMLQKYQILSITQQNLQEISFNQWKLQLYIYKSISRNLQKFVITS